MENKPSALMPTDMGVTSSIQDFERHLSSLQAGIRSGTRRSKREDPMTQPIPTEWWKALISSLDNCDEPTLKEHLWLGVDKRHHQKPLLLHEPLLHEHSYICGGTGTGKTAKVLTPLALQLIQRSDSALVFLDMKGDPALFHTLRHQAAKSKRRFRFFTTALGNSTYAYNPFSSLRDGKRSILESAEQLLSALRLNHGPGAESGYYTGMNRDYLLSALLQGQYQSFEELRAAHENLVANFDPKERQHTKEISNAIRALASLTPLNATAENSTPEVLAEAIHMPRVVEDREIAYFYLPALDGQVTAREIAGLAMWDLIRCARPDQQAYCIIDEFQCVLAANCALLLEQARSRNVGFLLCNQNFSSLKNEDVDLRNPVWSNTRVKVFLSIEPEVRELLTESCGEKTVFEEDHSVNETLSHTEGTNENDGISETWGTQNAKTRSKAHSLTNSSSSTEGTAYGNNKTNIHSNGAAHTVTAGGGTGSAQNHMAAKGGSRGNATQDGVAVSANATGNESQMLSDSGSTQGFSSGRGVGQTDSHANSTSVSANWSESNGAAISQNTNYAQADTNTRANSAAVGTSVVQSEAKTHGQTEGETTTDGETSGVSHAVSQSKQHGSSSSDTVGQGRAVTLRAVTKPGISPNLLETVDKNDNTGLVFIPRGSEYTVSKEGYFLAWLGYALTRDDYDRFNKNEPWPLAPMQVGECFPPILNKGAAPSAGPSRNPPRVAVSSGMVLTPEQTQSAKDYARIWGRNPKEANKMVKDGKVYFEHLREQVETYLLLAESNPKGAEERFPQAKEAIAWMPSARTGRFPNKGVTEGATTTEEVAKGDTEAAASRPKLPVAPAEKLAQARASLEQIQMRLQREREGSD